MPTKSPDVRADTVLRPQRRATAAAERRIARAKEHFLRDDPVDDDAVRDSILASWIRSRDFRVSADPFDLPFLGEPDGSLLEHSAESVLDATSDRFAGEPACLILTDAEGLVLDRRVRDPRLRRKLDSVSLVPGFSYNERFAGTNGIGTALEARGPAQVFGHEHFVDHLEDLACAGAPIRHPVTGKVVGLVDITCWSQDATLMMNAVVATLADRIQEALLAATGQHEHALLRDYLAACKRVGSPVLAVSTDLVMINDVARRLIDPSDLPVIVGTALEALTGDRPKVVSLPLPGGGIARLHCRPSGGADRPPGGTVQVQLFPALRTTPAPSAGREGQWARHGAVGTSPRWTQAAQAIETQRRQEEWVDVHGESGAGKVALIRAAHLGLDPTGHLRVMDADDFCPGWLDEVGAELSRETGTLVLRRVDRLPVSALPALTELLSATAQRPVHPWVAITRATRESVDPRLARLIGCFPNSVPVPPLRHHVEDLPELVRVLVRRVSRSADLQCSPQALSVLKRLDWPGNVTQLIGVLQKTVERRRTGIITAADLPAECHATSRRVLTPMESLERDAIVDALTRTDGNRAAAARSLGMSRATIYRKIRQFGIRVPAGG